MNGKTDCMPPCLIKVFSAHQHCIAHQVTRIKIWIIKYSIVKIVKALISFHSYFYIDYPIIKWKKQNIHEQSFRTNITSYAYTIRPRLIFFFFWKEKSSPGSFANNININLHRQFTISQKLQRYWQKLAWYLRHLPTNHDLQY